MTNENPSDGETNIHRVQSRHNHANSNLYSISNEEFATTNPVYEADHSRSNFSNGRDPDVWKRQNHIPFETALGSPQPANDMPVNNNDVEKSNGKFTTMNPMYNPEEGDEPIASAGVRESREI